MKHIPNILTLLNLFLGCVALCMATQEAYTAAAVCIAISALLDVADGLAARLLNAYSSLGKELDSLADIISFGLVPSFIAFSMMMKLSDKFCLPYTAYIAFVMTLAAAYRLAKFNVSTDQTNEFKGMPVPANALFWACLALVAGLESDILYPHYVLLLCLLQAFLMISGIRMFSFKFKTFSWVENKVIYLYLLLSLIIFIVFGPLGLAAAVFCYPAASVLHFRFQNK